VDLRELDEAAPGLLLWRRLSPAQRKVLEAGESLPLSGIDPAVLRDVSAVLVRFPRLNAQLWHPEGQVALRRAALTPRMNLEPRDSGLWLFGRRPSAQVKEAPAPKADY
jgi:hypothetical protein